VAIVLGFCCHSATVRTRCCIVLVHVVKYIHGNRFSELLMCELELSKLEFVEKSLINSVGIEGISATPRHGDSSSTNRPPGSYVRPARFLCKK
jgi:hypothetical protein